MLIEVRVRYGFACAIATGKRGSVESSDEYDFAVST